MIVPAWIYGVGGLVIAGIGFGAGWAIQGGRWASADLARLEAELKNAKQNRDRVEDQARHYEGGRNVAQEASRARQVEIRTVYRDRVVDVVCAADDRIVRVLKHAIDGANSQARGEPVQPLPSASATADTARRSGT